MADIIGWFFILFLFSVVNACEIDKYSDLDNDHFLVNKIEINDKGCRYLLTQNDLEIKYTLTSNCNKYKLGQILKLKGVN